MKSLTCAFVLDTFLSSVGWVAMSLVHNERTKLTAGLFNGLAVAFLAAGLFAPAAALAYGISNLRIGAAYLAPLILVCVIGAATLHWIGLVRLGRLEE